MFSEKIRQKLVPNNSEDAMYRPIFFRLANEAEKKALNDLLDEKNHIKVYDTMWAQLKELVKSKKPTLSLTMPEIEEDIKIHLNGAHMADYGVWVYYPWADRIVHILDEPEFKAMRTNRNKYKITAKEQETLYQKRVGVIGLSVGQSVSLTMAMERSFGELRIADFDDLEITNLNRLRSGVHNMGLLKTVIVAREIAELDPYLNITCFPEGITDANLESFLLDNGKLDVLIDECDGVDVKIKCRVAAKKHGIPVLMEASDRGTIDIERFDLEPNRPILHGFVEHLDLSKMKGLKTMEDKLPYILPIVGIETMSPRLKASAVEIGQSISTWPQLASAVTLGGGITADICRRVLLDQLHVSGRYFIDVDELIGDPREEIKPYTYVTRHLTQEHMKELGDKVPFPDTDGIIKDEKIVREIMAAAVIAPSAGNNQPWQWYYDNGRLFLFVHEERSVAFANYKNMITYFSMGTALENVELKAKAMGLATDVQLFPLIGTGSESPVAMVVFREAKGIKKDDLVDYLHARHTNRIKGTGQKLDANAVADIKAAINDITPITFRLVEDASLIKEIADIAGKSEKLRMFIPQGHSDLFNREIRWDKESAERTRDGLDIRTLDLEAKDIVGFNVIKDARAIKLVSDWGMGSALESMTRNLVASASAVGLFSAPAFTPEYCVRIGHALERTWLAATKHKVAVQPVMASVLHFTRLHFGGANEMPEKIQKDFEALYTQFVKIFALSSTSETPLFLFRLGIADEPKVKSIRFNIDDIYCS